MKLCCFCSSFYLSMGEPAYSEVTPGSDAIIECLKDHWRMDNYEGAEEYRKNILKAETCENYEVAK